MSDFGDMGRMDANARHRVIVITGASSGIGRALALEYAQPGRTLHLIGRDEARLAETVAACRAKGADARAMRVDVRDRAAMSAALRAIDAERPVDLVIANAGISTGLPAGALWEEPDAVRALVDINLLGVLNTVEPLIPAFCARKKGALALMGSMNGLRGMPYCPAYCAAKAAVHVYAQSLRAGLAPQGVQVSLIVPGFVHTPLNEKLVAPKPLAISDAKAARIIRAGLERAKATIAFPKSIYWGVRLLDALPTRIVDFFLARQKVDVPVTRERASDGAKTDAAGAQ
jgi:NADP-dependent 3-hydroxy acid dehydrogenase YdfG